MVFLKTSNDCQIELSNEIYLAFNPHSLAIHATPSLLPTGLPAGVTRFSKLVMFTSCQDIVVLSS